LFFSFSIGSISQQRTWQVISDSGTSWIIGPTAFIEQIVRAINATYDAENELVRLFTWDLGDRRKTNR
jgi:hypothetical protein